jgi:predicted ArsR family transcriptional regulator
VTAWGFLTNHGLVLVYLGRNPDSTGLDIAQALRITERAVRTIVADLHAAGYLDPEKVGRRNRYRMHPDKPLRHVGQRAVTVGELLEVLWRDTDRAPENTTDLTTSPPSKL